MGIRARMNLRFDRLEDIVGFVDVARPRFVVLDYMVVMFAPLLAVSTGEYLNRRYRKPRTFLLPRDPWSARHPVEDELEKRGYAAILVKEERDRDAILAYKLYELGGEKRIPVYRMLSEGLRKARPRDKPRHRGKLVCGDLEFKVYSTDATWYAGIGGILYSFPSLKRLHSHFEQRLGQECAYHEWSGKTRTHAKPKRRVKVVKPRKPRGTLKKKREAGSRG